MKPSDIVLSTPPLTACFKKTEAECAAGLLIYAMQKNGDSWEAITPVQIGTIMKENKTEVPLCHWNRNPFFNPDFEHLSKNGFITPIDGSHNQAITFTELGLERLRISPWNKLQS